MPRTGRPKIKPTARRGRFLTLRMTDAERALIDQAATKAGKCVTTWARAMLLATMSNSQPGDAVLPSTRDTPP